MAELLSLLGRGFLLVPVVGKRCSETINLLYLIYHKNTSLSIIIL